MAEPVMVEVREARSRFGRVVKWLFLGFHLLMVLLLLGTCAVVTPFLGREDPEVALGAASFGAMTIGALWLLWPLGTILLGILMLLTRGRRRLVPVERIAPPAA